MNNSESINSSRELISQTELKVASGSGKVKESKVEKRNKSKVKKNKLDSNHHSPDIIDESVGDISDLNSIEKDSKFKIPRSMKRGRTDEFNERKKQKMKTRPPDSFNNYSNDDSERHLNSSSEIIIGGDKIRLETDEDSANKCNKVDEKSISRSSSCPSGLIPEPPPKKKKKDTKVIFIVPKPSNPPKIHNTSENLRGTLTHRFLFSAKLLTYSQLINLLKQQNFVSKNLWTKKSRLGRLCQCISSSKLPLSKDQNLLKLISLGLLNYDNTEEFHRDIIMSFYVRYSSKAQFEDTEETWKSLGFSNSKITENEIREDCILLTILHLLYMFENAITINNDIQHMCTRKEVKMMSLLQGLMRNSLRVLRNGLINSLILKETEIDEITIFFQMHCGVVAALVENADHVGGVMKAYRDIIAAVGKDPAMFRRKFIAMN